MAAAPPAAGADLAEALSVAIGSIGDAGGAASHIAARPSVLASARNTRDSVGQMVYPAGFGAAFGLAEVGVPELAAADILVLDRTRTYLIVRSDFGVDTSQDYAFGKEAMALRVRGRFAVGVPALEKSLRRLDVVPGGRRPPGRAARPRKRAATATIIRAPGRSDSAAPNRSLTSRNIPRNVWCGFF